MVEVKFLRKNNDEIRGFVAQGHTGFADAGQDIVCAAVSALIQTAVMSLQKVVQLEIELIVKEGYLKCNLPAKFNKEQYDASQVVLKTLFVGIKAIKEEYSEFILIEEV